MTSRDQPRAQAGDPQSPPRVSGDELFVPASHVLITDRQVSHPAFRLWCVLHRLWFLHEPPVMELLQELMGTTITDKATQAETWQPATTRRATSAKAQALVIAPPDASPLEIQYLALDLEEGAPTERAGQSAGAPRRHAGAFVPAQARERCGMTREATPTTSWARASVTLPTLIVAPGPEPDDEERTEATPPTRCPECDGADFFVADVPYGHPRFGELIPCRCKLAERQRRQSAQIARMSNLQSFRDLTFATFDPDVPGVRKAYLRALDFARQPRGWLLLFGPCGVGKTHLATAAANQALDRNERVPFAVVPDLIDHLRSTFGPSSEVAYDERFELVWTVPLLILDDLGTESATTWAREKLYGAASYAY